MQLHVSSPSLFVFLKLTALSHERKKSQERKSNQNLENFQTIFGSILFRPPVFFMTPSYKLYIGCYIARYYVRK